MPATIAQVCAAIGAVVVAATPDVEPGTAYTLVTDDRDLREVSATGGGSDSSRVVQIDPGEVVGVGSWRQGSYSLQQVVTVRARYYLAERARDWRSKRLMAASDLARWLHCLLNPGAKWGGVPILKIEFGSSRMPQRGELDGRYAFAELDLVVTYSVVGLPL